MKAVICDRYGPPDVLWLRDIPRPVPRPDEVRIKIHATTVNRSDCGYRHGAPPYARLFTGLLRPRRRILGTELAGLRPADVRKGRSILIYGASGSIGTAAVQLSRYFGADVTAVCNTKNLEIIRSLGADQVIDYTQEDFTANGRTYDVIFDAVGKHSFRRCQGSLNRGGIYLATDQLRNVVLALWTSRLGDKKVVFPIPPRYTKQDVLFLKDLIEAGQYRAVIDRYYPLADVVEATRYVETEQKTGNVVLTVG
jgi:NADPH:quinone reductase-like Zn-dependent oxidoreductase